jgi:hypothetical protein
MATLALVALASTFASSAAVGTVLASVALAAASVAGSYIDGKLFGAKPSDQTGSPKLDSLKVTSSTEGIAIPRVYGTVRVGAEVIWATEFEEVPAGSGSGGKGGGGSSSAGQSYDYFGNFALALCEGEITSVDKMWIDGKETALSDYTHRIYLGSETQLPDSLIETKEGSGNAPAYRGVAYIIFERMPLAKYGNRIPQCNFEITKKPTVFWSDAPTDKSVMDNRAIERIIKNIMEDYSFSEFNIDLPGEVQGYILNNVASLRDSLQPLLAVGLAEVIESGSVIKFVARNKVVQPVIIDQLELLDPNGADSAQTSSTVDSDAYQPLITLNRLQETDLPLYHVLKYQDRDNEYSISTVSSSRQLVRTSRKVESNSPTVLRRSYAQSVSDSILAQSWIERETAELTLMPSMLRIEPTDLVGVGDYMNTGRIITLKVVSVEEGFARRIAAVKSINQPTNNIFISSDRKPIPSQVAPVYGQSKIFIVKSPLLVDSDIDGQSYIASNQTPWPTTVSVYSSATTSGYTLKKNVTQRAFVGAIQPGTVWQRGVTGIWDTSTKLVVKMANGQLSSATDSAVLSGTNTALVQNSAGTWEVIQFVNATLIAENTYELSRFLRAQRGSDYALDVNVANYSTFVVFNTALQDFNFTASELGNVYNLSYGPAVYTIGHPTFQNESYTVSNETMRCYSPTNVRLDRLGSSYIISWKRRARREGDTWDTVDPPLGETFEEYRVTIRNSTGAVVRTANVTEQRYIYTITNYISDFGTDQIAPLDFEVVQVNNYGEGHPKREKLPLLSVAA